MSTTPESTQAPANTKTPDNIIKIEERVFRGPHHRRPDPEDFPFRLIDMRDERYR